jgi:hypothetical protein
MGVKYIIGEPNWFAVETAGDEAPDRLIRRQNALPDASVIVSGTAPSSAAQYPRQSASQAWASAGRTARTFNGADIGIRSHRGGTWHSIRLDCLERKPYVGNSRCAYG